MPKTKNASKAGKKPRSKSWFVIPAADERAIGWLPANAVVTSLDCRSMNTLRKKGAPKKKTVKTGSISQDFTISSATIVETTGTLTFKAASGQKPSSISSHFDHVRTTFGSTKSQKIESMKVIIPGRGRQRRELFFIKKSHYTANWQTKTGQIRRPPTELELVLIDGKKPTKLDESWANARIPQGRIRKKKAVNLTNIEIVS